MKQKNYIIRKKNATSENKISQEIISKPKPKPKEKEIKKSDRELTINFEELMQSKYWINAVFLVILFIVGLSIYSNIFDNQPQFDDVLWTDFPEFKQLDKPMEIVKLGRLRALTLLSFAVNYHFSEMNLTSYFVFNLSVHFINTLLVWLILQLLLKSPVLRDNPISKYAKLVAFLAALIFITHPIMTQSVTYIYQRLSSFATMFYLLTVYIFLKARLSDNRTKKSLFYILCFFSFGIGTFTKEIIFTAPIMLLVINEFFFHQKIRIKLYHLLILLVAGGLAIYIGVEMLGIKQLFGVKKSYFGEEITNYTYFITQFLVVVKYLQLFVFPYNQNFDYDWHLLTTFLDLRVILPLILHLAVLTGSYFLFKKNRLAAFGIVWIYLTLSVESTFIPIEDIIFEHRMYLPMLGFSVFLVSIIFSHIKEKHIKIAAYALVTWALINGAFTFYRNTIWDTPVSLWTDVIKKSPNKTRAHIFLAHAYIFNNEYEKALEVYSQAIRKAPDKKSAYMGRAVAYFSMGKHQQAIDDYTIAIKIAPDDELLYEDRAKAFISLNQYQNAINDLSFVLKNLNPKHLWTVNYYLGEAYMYLGQYEEAEFYAHKSFKLNRNRATSEKLLINIAIKSGNFQKAIDLCANIIATDPNNVEAYIIRGDAYNASNQPFEAIKDYNNAYEFDNKNIGILKKIAVIYYDLKNFKKSAETFKKIAEIIPDDAEIYSDMGSSYYLAGDPQKAIECYQRALQINPNFEIARQRIIYIENEMKRISLGIGQGY